MKRFAFYSAYREMDDRQIDFLRGEALLNAKYAIGIDVLFLQVSVAKHKSWLHSIYIQIGHFISNFLWYLRMLCRGHVILPVPLISRLLYLVTSFFKVKPKPPFATVAELYFAKWPSESDYEDVIATYIRYVARPGERFGLCPYDHRFLSMLRYWDNYKQILNFVFYALNPSAYFSLYSGYLIWQSPIKIAIARTIPVMVLSCHDRLYRVSDSQIPKQMVLNQNLLQSEDMVDGLPTVDKLVHAGTEILNQRLVGIIDSSTSYMARSAYQRCSTDSFWEIRTFSNCCNHVTQDILKNMTRGFVVIFMHEFSDYHHYGVLPDFVSSYYDWFCQTISYLESSSIPYVVKIHPQIMSYPERYSQTINALIAYCKASAFKIPVLAGEVTTNDLVECGMSLGLTIRGTVAIELAFMRIPFICSGNPPYAYLFPKRIELSCFHYFKRLSQYWLEPAVTEIESESAAYYVAEEGYLRKIPEVKLNASNELVCSPIELYLET